MIVIENSTDRLKYGRLVISRMRRRPDLAIAPIQPEDLAVLSRLRRAREHYSDLVPSSAIWREAKLLAMMNHMMRLL
jgi:hypothetical protein